MTRPLSPSPGLVGAEEPRLRLNERGQCPPCGRKPLTYKRRRMFFCCKCDREFSMDTQEHVPNWAWIDDGSGGLMRKPLVRWQG